MPRSLGARRAQRQPVPPAQPMQVCQHGGSFDAECLATGRVCGLRVLRLLLARMLLLSADANRGFDLAAPRISYLPRGNYQPSASMRDTNARGGQAGLTECSDLEPEMLGLGGECSSGGLMYRCMGQSKAGGMPRLERRGPHDCLAQHLAAACRSPATALCVPPLSRESGPSIVLYPVSCPLPTVEARVLPPLQSGRGGGPYTRGRVCACGLIPARACNVMTHPRSRFPT